MAVRGEDGPSRHLLTKILPLGHVEVVSSSSGIPQDAIPVINQLGGEGWQVFDVDRERVDDAIAWTYWLKRPLA